jgi:hypothetical protein
MTTGPLTITPAPRMSNTRYPPGPTFGSPSLSPEEQAMRPRCAGVPTTRPPTPARVRGATDRVPPAFHDRIADDLVSGRPRPQMPR